MRKRARVVGVHEGKGAEPVDRCRGERLPVVLGGHLTVKRQILGAFARGHGQVMVSEDGRMAALAYKPHTGLGLGAVAYDVPQAVYAIRRAGIDDAENRLKGGQVAVDI